jgi:hypothetical protein
MRDFKFFEKGTVDMMDGETYVTASFNDDTPEGHMGRRRLYHTNLPEYERQRMQTINDTNPIRLFQTTTVTRINPKWWMKVKIVLQESWRFEPIGVVVVSILLTMVTIIGIAKILSIW